nr:hypothetical protein [Acidobacteriota bacterium]
LERPHAKIGTGSVNGHGAASKDLNEPGQLVLVPGFMGSQLVRGCDRQLIWVDPLRIVRYSREFRDDLSLDLWIRSADAWMSLESLDAEIRLAKVRRETLEEDVIIFYRRFEAILMAEHASWKRVRGTEHSTSGRPA